MEFQGSESGVTTLHMPDSFLGQEKLHQGINGICSSSGSIEDTEEPRVKIVHHNPNETLKIRYKVQEVKTSFARPFLRESYFFFFGDTFFVIPDFKDQVNVHLKWEGFPEDWAFANSFGMARNQDITMPLDGLKYAVYLGGDFNIIKRGSENAPIFIAVRKECSFPEHRLIHAVERIVESQRQFWNDFDFPYFLVTILPVEENHCGGTVATNAMSVFINPSMTLDQVETLLSHEHFHLWNALKIRFNPSDNYSRWFMEGFTDYYALTLNLRAQLLEPSEYCKKINSVIDNYNSSPVRNAPDAQIKEFFWKDLNLQRLPYLRGCLLAFHWNKKSSLDEVMLTLLEKSRARNYERFSEEELVKFLAQSIDGGAQDIEKYIIRGETLDVPECTLSDISTSPLPALKP